MIIVPVHLVNTMLLLGALGVTAWWSSGNPGLRLDEHPAETKRLAIGAAGLLTLATLGALNALADTLYPADDFLTGVRDELSSGAPFLVQARVLHPLLAILIGLGVAHLAVNMSSGATTRLLGRIIGGLVLVQFAVGITNVFLATPLETQVVHLAVANALWIAYVMFSASLLGETVATAHPASSRT